MTANHRVARRRAGKSPKNQAKEKPNPRQCLTLKNGIRIGKLPEQPKMKA